MFKAVCPKKAHTEEENVKWRPKEGMSSSSIDTFINKGTKTTRKVATVPLQPHA